MFKQKRSKKEKRKEKKEGSNARRKIRARSSH